MLTSRERVALALDHQEPDRVPLDLGGSPATSMHVSSVYLLRQALKLDPPGTPVKVVEPFQMLGEIKPDLLEAVGADVVPLSSLKTFFGFMNEGWKPWTFWDGTPLLVPEDFNTQPDPNGDILLYPEGDRSAPPSGRMPMGGFYFDVIVRQPPIDESRLDPEDNVEDFGPISDNELEYYRQEAERLYTETDKAIMACFGGTSFGDIGLVPAPWLKYPKGIRDIEQWYISTVKRKDYIFRVFERQCEIGLANLEKLYRVVGDRVAAVFVNGADFGTQTGPLVSRRTYRELFMPFHQTVNAWIHAHTPWKTLHHSCGSVMALMPDFVEAGFDIFNPVQCSAANMKPQELKDRYGQQLVFWGGGADTQYTLPFGSADEVRREVRERIRIFGPGGGYIFNTVHNVQAGIPTENLVALYVAVRDYGHYPFQ